jgi:chromosome partitioning protein
VLADERPGGLRTVVESTGWPHTCGRSPLLAASSPQLSVREAQLATDPLGGQDRLQLAMNGVAWPLVIVDCPPSLGLLTINALFAADRALLVTEPGAWAADGVVRMLQTIERIRLRRTDGSPRLVGIAVNRLGRTRDARYWHDQLVETYPETAQSLPIHGLGSRPGATEAAAEFDVLLDRVLDEGAMT